MMYFLVVILTYQREAVLIDAIARLKGLPHLNKVLVIWNNPLPPAADLRWPEIGVEVLVSIKQGNSVTRDLPPTGSEANTTIFLYIYIGYRFPLSLSTIWGNHLPVNFMLKKIIFTIWRNHLPFNQ